MAGHPNLLSQYLHALAKGVPYRPGALDAQNRKKEYGSSTARTEPKRSSAAGIDDPALILLGTPLPVIDAAAVTELLSHIGRPAGAQLTDEAAAALAAGALALVARPYRLAEIITLLPLNAVGRPRCLRVGAIELDPAGLHVYVRDERLKLPLREIQLAATSISPLRSSPLKLVVIDGEAGEETCTDHLGAKPTPPRT
jgi:DNA-binding response OmpR family regulator